MLVGEAPGKDEDRYNQPFIGRSGKLLDELLGQAGIDLSVCRWTNVVRCIPKVNGKVEAPNPNDAKTCSAAWLFYEIAVQKPEVIVALGKTASIALTGSRAAIDRLRGFQHSFRFPDDFIAEAEAKYGLVLYEAIPELTGGLPQQRYNKKTCKSVEYPVVVSYHPAASLHRKSQNVAGFIASDLIYARKVAYNESRLDGVDYRVVQSIEELNQWADYFVGLYRSGQTPWLSLDTETGGVDDTAGLRVFDPATELVSIQLSWAPKTGIVIPVSHPEGNFANAFGVSAIRSFMKRLFVDEGIPAIGTNLSFDYKQIFCKLGVRLGSIAFDAMQAHQFLFVGSQPNDLDYLAAKYCGMQGYGDGLKERMGKLPKGKKSFQNLPLDSSYVAYACGDTDSVYRMAPTIIQELTDRKLLGPFQECVLNAIIPLAEMEINGIPIDLAVYDWLKYEMPNHLDSIMEPLRKSPFYLAFLQRSGCPEHYQKMLVEGTAPQSVRKWDFNPGSVNQKVDLLFDVMGLPKSKEHVSKTTQNQSTDKRAMSHLHDVCSSNGWSEHLAVVKSLQEYTTVAKLNSAYVTNMGNVVDDKGGPRHELFAPFYPDELVPWSWHPRYKQEGTQTGRLSASDPAIHNMPSKSAIKRLARSRWRDRGGVHLQFDYGAMEVRILACSVMANDPTLKAAFNQGFDAHKYVAALIFNKPIEHVTAEERKICKTVNFATLYGSGPENVAGLLGVSKTRAEKFIAEYLGALPAVARWKVSQERFALENGCVYSAFGRVRPLTLDVYSQGEIERRAVNTPIQSTASDVTLTSYIRLYHYLKSTGYKSLPYLFVHDSLGFDVYPPEYFDLWELVHYQMSVVPPQIYPWLDVPLAVDSDSGYSWGAMAGVERFDRNHWKVVGKEENCAALVHQLLLGGHHIRYSVTEEVVDDKKASAWHLEVSR